MIGGFHINMAVLKFLCTRLHECGLTAAITEAEVVQHNILERDIHMSVALHNQR